MALFALRRLVLAIPLLIGITFISYVVISLAPGGPLDFLTPEDPNASDLTLLLATILTGIAAGALLILLISAFKGKAKAS